MNAWGTLYLDYVEPTLLIAVINGRDTSVTRDGEPCLDMDASRGGRFAAAYNDWERSKGHAATHLRVYRRAYLIGGYNANLLRYNPYTDHP